MRTQWIAAIAVFCALAMVLTDGWAASSPRGVARASFGKAGVTVQYGRPSLLGRDVLNLIEPGQLWRLGADAPTTIQSDTALDFGDGVRVQRGKHILIVRYIRPGVWSLVFSKAPAIDYAPSTRLAETLMRFERTRTPVQELNIHLYSKNGKGLIQIAWGAYRLSARFVPAR
jgi:hypothetical protein